MAESQENSSDQARPSQRQGEEEDLGDRLRGLQMEDRPSLEGRAPPRPHPTPKTLERAFQMARDLVTYITSDDPNLERGLRFKKSIDDALAPYREVYNKETHNGPKGFASSSHNSNLDAQSNSRYVANQARPLVPRLDFGSSTRRQERQNMTSSGGFPLPGAVAPSLGGDAARQRARQRPPPDALPNTAARERMKICQPMNSTGKLQLSNGVSFDFTAEDLQDRGEIGRGAFGAVNKMIHRDTNTVMAVKRIRSTVDEKEQKQLLMDLDVVMRSNGCPCIVQFYGALFKEGDCWICMELMDTSLDKFYKFIFERLNTRIPECIIAKITVDTVDALNYLKETLKIIHRDVKPSNILLDRRGKIKLCDFGISGKLVDSIAKTRDAGCRPYMAPERIDPQLARGYDVRSDVWSLGITLMEVATGRFPYPRWGSVFEQLTQVVQGDPPRLTSDNGNAFSQDFLDFVNTCLIKEEHCRPKYKALLEHPFIRSGMRESPDVAGYVSGILQEMDQQQWEHQ